MLGLNCTLFQYRSVTRPFPRQKLPKLKGKIFQIRGFGSYFGVGGRAKGHHVVSRQEEKKEYSRQRDAGREDGQLVVVEMPPGSSREGVGGKAEAVPQSNLSHNNSLQSPKEKFDSSFQSYAVIILNQRFLGSTPEN